MSQGLVGCDSAGRTQLLSLGIPKQKPRLLGCCDCRGDQYIHHRRTEAPGVASVRTPGRNLSRPSLDLIRLDRATYVSLPVLQETQQLPAVLTVASCRTRHCHRRRHQKQARLSTPLLVRHRRRRVADDTSHASLTAESSRPGRPEVQHQLCRQKCHQPPHWSAEMCRC